MQGAASKSTSKSTREGEERRDKSDNVRYNVIMPNIVVKQLMTENDQRVQMCRKVLQVVAHYRQRHAIPESGRQEAEC